MKNEKKETALISDKLISYLREKLKNPEIEYGSSLTQLQGGYATSNYHFKLNGIKGELSERLVLRLFPQVYGPQSALWESSVQNVLVDEGYPVAKVFLVCTDMSILGGVFFIMAYLTGQVLMTAAPETMPEVLGKTHAELHKINPEPLVRALEEKGIDESAYTLTRGFDWLNDRASELPWIHDSVSWLKENRPPEPERLAVCHGDFHALNILYDDGKVTGVLDWPDFTIADPVFDVANTLLLTTIPLKRLAASMDYIPTMDWDIAAERYLAAYRTHRPLDSTNLDYYRVRRCVLALVQGFYEGQEVWQHSLVLNDVVGYIQEITGIQIAVPN